jgi:hypothetical protein
MSKGYYNLSLFRHHENGGHIEFVRVGPYLILKLIYQKTCVEKFMLPSSSEQFCKEKKMHYSAKP